MRSARQTEILEALPGPAWILDCLLLQVEQCNAAAAQLSAAPDGLPCFDKLLNPEAVARLRSRDRAVSFDARLPHDGNMWLFSATQLESPSGSPALRRLLLAQPAARFEIPAQLTFDELLDSSFDGLVILDSERRIVQFNRPFREMFGYSTEELRGQTPAVLIPPERSAEFDRANELLDAGGVHRIETQRRHRDGRLVEVCVSSQPIYSGRFRGGWVGVYQDITATNRNARQRNLRIESNRILAGAANLADAARELLPAICHAMDWDVARLWLATDQGLQRVHVFAAPGAECSRAGVPPSECAQNILGAIQGLSQEVQCFHPNKACANHEDCRLRNGSQLAVPILDPQKQVLGVLEVLTNGRANDEVGRREVLEGICAHLGQFITRAQAEQALAENEERFRTLAETVPVAIFIHDGRHIIYANAASETLSGYSRAEIDNLNVWDIFHPEDAAELRERYDRRQRGEAVGKRWEARLMRKNGEVRWVDYSAARVMLAHKPAVLCAAIDTTDQRTLEIQLRQTQKLEAVGRLAGGVAHDFNNLLTVIGCCSESMLAKTDLDPDVYRSAHEISQAVDRAAGLTRQLLSFSRHQLVTPKLVDLSAILMSTELILRRALGEDITLRMELVSGQTILAEPSQVEQVVLNLAVNARDAMPDGGELRISMRHAPPQECAGGNIHGYVVLSVADNGCGMSQEVLQHIFEPFFTTKQSSRGTGLGLSTVYGIVKQCGGAIKVKSELGRGSEFEVLFPIAAQSAEEASPQAAAESLAEVHATILLVEDENDLRGVLRNMLMRAGHTVLEAADAPQALRRSAAHAGHIDLLITDVVMPGMSGRELADELAVLRPRTKVLFISGYNEDTMLQKGVVEGQMEFLQKPFALKVLAQRVRQLLTQERNETRAV